MVKAILTAAAVCASALGAAAAPTIEPLYSSVVNDKVNNAQTPCGLAKLPDGSYVTCFIDGGDGVAGCVTYFSRTYNLGKSWRQPFMTEKPLKKEDGVGVGFTQLSNGKILSVRNTITHSDLTQEGFKSFRYGYSEIVELDFARKSIKPLFRLKSPMQSFNAPMGTNFVELSNGDILLPTYFYPWGGGQTGEKGETYGSGFYRSKDGGKTWGDFEKVFKEPDPAKPYDFNESVIIEKPNGDLVAYARIDSRPVTNMWKAVSRDKGYTWSDPVQTDIPVAWPLVVKAKKGGYLMAAGYRKAAVYGTVTLFYSEDGESFQPIGVPKYTRPGHGGPYNSATGGGQSMIEIAPDTFMITFYSADPVLPGRDHCYVDSCVFKLVR